MINSEKSINAVELFIASQDVQKARTTLIELYTEWVNSESNYDKNICRFVTDQFKSFMNLMNECLEIQNEREEKLCKN